MWWQKWSWATGHDLGNTLSFLLNALRCSTYTKLCLLLGHPENTHSVTKTQLDPQNLQLSREAFKRRVGGATTRTRPQCKQNLHLFSTSRNSTPPPLLPGHTMSLLKYQHPPGTLESSITPCPRRLGNQQGTKKAMPPTRVKELALLSPSPRFSEAPAPRIRTGRSEIVAITKSLPSVFLGKSCHHGQPGRQAGLCTALKGVRAPRLLQLMVWTGPRRRPPGSHQREVDLPPPSPALNFFPQAPSASFSYLSLILKL